ncbi:MAG: succinate dehydrogenase assembly factor 2 [Rhodospirillaceae bacterium]
MDARRKRLLFRATHCGMRENDILLGGFAEAEIHRLSDVHLDQFEALLGFPDNDLYNWASGRTPPPAEADTPVFRMIFNFNSGNPSGDE